MRRFLLVFAVLLGLAGFYQFVDAMGGRGSGILATLTILGTLAVIASAGIIERLDKILAKP